MIPVGYGDVVLVDLDPTIGSEERKTRPAIVVSNDAINRYAPIFIAVPLTSNVETRSPTQVILRKSPSNGLRADSRALCEHVRSMDKRRIRARWGRLSREEMREVEEALRVALNQF